jgi:hypothetical protein
MLRVPPMPVPLRGSCGGNDPSCVTIPGMGPIVTTATFVLAVVACSSGEPLEIRGEMSNAVGEQATIETDTTAVPSDEVRSESQMPVAASNPYPRCRYEGEGWQRYCYPSYGVWGMETWHTDGTVSSLCSGGVDCNTCWCAVSCGTLWTGIPGASGTEEVVCPQPLSGTVTPTCVRQDSGAGTCRLFCENGGRCPDGMQCVRSPEIENRVCAWVTGPSGSAGP